MNRRSARLGGVLGLAFTFGMAACHHNSTAPAVIQQCPCYRVAPAPVQPQSTLPASWSGRYALPA